MLHVNSSAPLLCSAPRPCLPCHVRLALPHSGHSPPALHLPLSTVCRPSPPCVAPPLPPMAWRRAEEVLHAVARGVDLFDCTSVPPLPHACTPPLHAPSSNLPCMSVSACAMPYPHDLTLLGLASTLPLHPPWWPHTVAPGEGEGQGGTKEERDGGAVEADGVLSEVGKEKEGEEVYGSKMNLRCSSHKRSFIPISRTCACYTCTRHTRAYLHHLLDAHEMLALVLLDM
ncbi:unnamed protein product [Closterium sp. NIES-65]|nr:unnamed protein product [Closterium sp. NIES-65]